MDARCNDRPSLLLADDDITYCQVLAKALAARGSSWFSRKRASRSW